MQDNKNISAYRESLKERILSEAMTAFAERGIRAVKMDDIACALSISKRTLYEVYENKEDLLLEGIKRHKQRHRERISDFAAKSESVMDILIYVIRETLEELRDTNASFYTDILRYPKVQHYFETERQSSEEQFLSFMQRGVAEGYFLKDVNYELAMRILDSNRRYILTSQLYKLYSMEEIHLNLMLISLRGFCTVKGIEVLDQFFESRKANA